MVTLLEFRTARDLTKMPWRFSWARQFNVPLFTDLKERVYADLENIDPRPNLQEKRVPYNRGWGRDYSI